MAPNQAAFLAARSPRRRARRPADTAGPAAPALVAAGFDDVALTLTLTFDQAVDASAMVGNAVVVDDAAGTGTQYAAIEPAAAPSPTTVEVAMTEVQAATGAGVRLTAGAGNGIVAADGGAAWAGVSGLELPFP